MSGIVIWLGKLYHGTLKRHQGIRGFDDTSTYEAHRTYCLAMIIAYMQKLADDMFNENLLVIANRTWNTVVSKRDWKTEPESGGNHDHHV